MTKKEKSIYRHKFFVILWKRREDSKGIIKCFECDKNLKRQTYMLNSSVYSHILDKSTYPDYEFTPDNIEICCPKCHKVYTDTPKQAKKQYNKLKQLKKRWLN